jgi:hypothetical protein
MTEKIKIINDYKVIEYDKTNIYIIENILTDEFCKKVIELINVIPKKKLTYCPGNNVECYISDINELLKLDDELYYSFSTEASEYKKNIEKIEQNIPISTNKLNRIKQTAITNLNCDINDIMSKINSIMKEINSYINLSSNTGYCLRKIYGKTALHIDNISEIFDSNVNFIYKNNHDEYRMIRNTSIIFSLNDDYEGGEFVFPYQQLTLKLKKGSVIIFPPYWTHPHETNMLINGTFRYTINTWSCVKI